MRVLLVTPLFFPSLSGAAVYFDTLSQMLGRVAPSTRATILTRAVAGAPRMEQRGSVRILRLLPAARADRTRLGERGAGLATAVVMLLVSLVLRSDVVHYHTLVSYRAMHRLARLFRAPVVGDMRDLAAKHEGADLGQYGHCRRLICASENIRDYLLAAGFPPERLVHVPIPFLPPVPAPPAAVAAVRARYGVRDLPYALFIGAILPAKGVAELVAAMALVWQQLPELHLALAGPLTREGDAHFPGGFRTHVGRDARLHYLGPVPHEDVLLLLQAAELFVLPSWAEGLGRSGLEAIALGRKAILPPGVPEFGTACPEAVLEVVTPAAIAEHIVRTRRAGKPPAYPLERHDAARSAAATLAVYRAAQSPHITG
ncbi:MAG: glycosyltransferase family 4 protein [Candidatus Rokuibacteriota bacterium]